MCRVNARRRVMLACVIAVLHGAFFIRYQRPDWHTQWTDQEGYERLGSALATTGRFTPYPDSPQFIPEVIRTPAYPAFLAVVYRLFGTAQIYVAAAQTGLFVMICLLVSAIARRVASDSIAATAAIVTALFPPIPYFGALVMTEVWTTFLFTASVWLAVLALADGGSPNSRFNVRACIGLGILCGLTTLSRPAFVLFPIFLAGIALMLFPLMRIRTSVAFSRVMVMLAAFAVVMLPWFAYNYEHVGRFTLSPAGGVGRGLWEGSWQAVWPGRLQSELTSLADHTGDSAELDRQVTAVASREQLPSQPMLDYVHQWKELHLIWDTPTDPYQRTMARMRADRSYLQTALQNLRHDRPLHQIARMARGAVILWAGEIPFRYSDINRLPPALIRFCWLIQVTLFALAMVGIYALCRLFPAAACILAAPIVYVTAVHLPLLTEARQSLPAQPVLLLLATLGAAHLVAPRRSHVISHRTADA
jgi:4-amino-4-deoxy-L-arabinose transferase-like glycosyltransferase